MIISPIASPSSPSVRFTAFDAPAITSTMKREEEDERQRISPGIAAGMRDQQVRTKCLKKWHVHCGVVGSARMQRQQHHADQPGRSATCSHELLPRRQSQVALLRDLCVVVPETDGAKGNQPEQRDPDIRIAQIGPEQSRDDNRR